MEKQIRKLFDCWLKKDAAPLSDIFTADAVYSECYGPEYRGIGQILRWFHDWNREGTVRAWDIQRILLCGRTAVVVWFFSYEHRGESGGFDGVTIADFDETGRISHLCEFESKAEHCFPYAESED